jgi:vitamin B12 transporter
MIIRSCMTTWPLAGLLLAVTPIHAEESAIDLRFDHTLREEIVVTASREPRAAREVGSALSWLDRRNIASRETPFAPELLREIPGLAVNRGGPVGGLTQIRMRGNEGNHTLVLIDGIEANDPAFGSEFNFASLQTLGVDHIEVLRGPQSALYGSDAVGGVISFRSALPDAGERQLFTDISGGSHGSTRAGISGAIGGNVLSGSLGASQYESGGINASRSGNEKDGYRTRTLNGLVEANLLDKLKTRLILRQTDSEVEEDTQDFNFPSTPTQGLLIDSANETDFHQRYGRAEILHGAIGDPFTQRLAISYAGTNNHFRDRGQTTAASRGTRRKAEYDASLHFGSDRLSHTLTAGLQHEELLFRYRVTDFAAANQNRNDDQTSGVLEYALGFDDRFWLSLSGRQDRNERFDDATTWRGTASWLLPDSGTRLHASIGEGITNPGFFELFGFIPSSFVGNGELKPETSVGYDIGIEQSFFEGVVVLDLTAFSADLRDEITTEFDFTTFSSTPVNLDGKSKRRGIEVSLQAELNEAWSLLGGYTYVDAEDRDGLREVRRPRHSGNLNVNFRFGGDRGNVNLGALLNGEQLDNEFIFSTLEDRVVLDGYTLMNLAASWAASDQLTVYARVDNLLDENYEELFSFRSPGRTGYVGVRVSLD